LAQDHAEVDDDLSYVLGTPEFAIASILLWNRASLGDWFPQLRLSKAAVSDIRYLLSWTVHHLSGVLRLVGHQFTLGLEFSPNALALVSGVGMDWISVGFTASRF
jgi:hypothetical protein